MKLKDLIGHKIIDISDYLELLIKTNKGIYELHVTTDLDESVSGVDIREVSEKMWKICNKENVR